MDTKINKLDTIFLRSTVTNQINQTIFVTDVTTLAPITLVNYPTTMVNYPTTMLELSDHYAELSDHYAELSEEKIVGEGEPATAAIKMSKQQLTKDYSIKTKP